jgi:purine-cytosine permease-like protein
MMLLWFSMSLATNNIVVGSMGTLVLGLSFKDAAICAVLGILVGTTTIGYMSTWGPRSGNRTLVSSYQIYGRKYFLFTSYSEFMLMGLMELMIDCRALFYGLLSQ